MCILWSCLCGGRQSINEDAFFMSMIRLVNDVNFLHTITILSIDRVQIHFSARTMQYFCSFLFWVKFLYYWILILFKQFSHGQLSFVFILQLLSANVRISIRYWKERILCMLKLVAKDWMYLFQAFGIVMILLSLLLLWSILLIGNGVRSFSCNLAIVVRLLTFIHFAA